MEGLAGIQFCSKREEQVQKFFIDAFDLICPVVAQDVIDFCERLREVAPAPVDDFESPAGMRVIERERSFGMHRRSQRRLIPTLPHI
jgi:hypothetical protein